MDNGNITDIFAGAGLLLFQVAEIPLDSTIFEIISKLGVVAVLWFWLKDMKQQMKEMLLHFDKETSELRAQHKEQTEGLKGIYERQINDKQKEVDELLKAIRKNNS